MEFQTNKNYTLVLDKRKISLFLIIPLFFLSSYVKSDDVDGLVASVGKASDAVNNLITTVLASSAGERAKLANYKSLHPNQVKLPKNNSISSPVIQIPDSEILEVSSKFPKNYMGKYVYGTVTFGDLVDYGPNLGYLIGFWASNKRPFYLETKNPQVAAKFKTYKYGTKFEIPRTCPLRIVEKGLFNYIVNLPFEAPITDQ